MAFSVPEMPLTVGVYSANEDGKAGIRLFTPGNLALGKRVSTQFWNWSYTGEAGVFAVLLCPKGTDIRDVFSAPFADYLEIPTGTGRWYIVDLVDDMGKGFDNEHRAVWCHKALIWPAPVP